MHTHLPYTHTHTPDTYAHTCQTKAKMVMDHVHMVNDHEHIMTVVLLNTLHTIYTLLDTFILLFLPCERNSDDVHIIDVV